MIDNFNFRKYCEEGVDWVWYNNNLMARPILIFYLELACPPMEGLKQTAL